VTSRTLIALGLAEATLIGALGWWPGATLPFPGLLLFAAAFATYGVAGLRIVGTPADAALRLGEGDGADENAPKGHSHASRLPAIWGVGILMRLMLVPLTPELSDDAYRYLWDGHVWFSGVNPYLFAPAAVDLAEIRTAWHGLINNPSVPTIYPPFAQLAFLMVAFAGSSLAGMKIFWLACDMLVAWVIVRIAEMTGRNREQALLLYLWAPLLVVEVAWSGHLETLGLLPMVLAIFCAAKASTALATTTRRWSILAGGTLALSALTKFAPIAALPVLARRFGWRPVVAFAATALVLYLPFLGAGWGLFAGLRTYGEHWWFMKGAFGLFEALLGDPVLARQAVGGVVGLVVVYVTLARFDLERALLWTLGAGMVLTPTLHPWYVLWTLPMAALRTSRPWLLLNGLAFIGYFGLGSYQQGGDWTQPLVARLALWVPFFVVLIVDGVRGSPAVEAAVQDGG